jgi:HEAT repeat protein
MNRYAVLMRTAAAIAAAGVPLLNCAEGAAEPTAARIGIGQDTPRPPAPDAGDAAQTRRAQQVRLLGMLTDAKTDLDGRRTALRLLTSDLRLPANETLGLLRPYLQQPSPDGPLLAETITALGTYGRAARPILPDLIRLAADRRQPYHVNVAAIQALPSVDPQDPRVVRTLASLIERSFEPKDLSPMSGALTAVLEGILRLGPGGRAAEAPLRKLLRFSMEDADARFTVEDQYLAFKALGNLHRRGARKPSLAASDAAELAAALADIERAGPKAAASLPGVLALFKGRDEPYVRVAAARALGAIGPGRSPAAVAALLDSIGARTAGDAVREALYQVGPDDVGILPTILEGLQDQSPDVRDAAALLLVRLAPQLGVTAAPAVDDLTKMIARADVKAIRVPPVGLYALALYQLGLPSAEAARVITAQLQPGSPLNPSGDLSLYAYTPQLFNALSRVGVPTSALPVLELGLRQNAPIVVAGAARAAGQLGPAAALLVPLLRRVLAGEVADLMVRRHLEGTCAFSAFSHEMSTSTKLEAILALGKIGPAAAPAVPLLKEIAAQVPKSAYETELNVSARQALRKIEGEPAPPALAILPAASAGSAGSAQAEVTPLTPMESAPLGEAGAVGFGRVAPPTALVDLKGSRYSSERWRGKVVALVFVNTACPGAMAYEQRLRTLAKRFGPYGFELVYVFADAEDQRESVDQLVSVRRYPWLTLRDDEQRLTRLFDIQVATQTVLLDRKGVLRYRGRIDDAPFEPEFVKDRTLENAVRAVLKGQPVAKQETRVISCALPRVASR